MAPPDKSPCLKCFRLHEDKESCSANCDQLRVFKGLPPAAKVRTTKEEVFVANDKKPLPKAIAEKIQAKLAASEVEMTVEKKDQSAARLCKNGDGRPAHKTSPYCLECCRANLVRNQEKGKGRPKIADNDLNPEEKLFNWTLETLPPFDPAWTPEVWQRWHTIWGYLWDLARDLDGVER